MNKSLLLFSGGQDSTTTLAWCLKKFDEVHLITFNYNQRHLVEISSANKIINKINKSFNYWKGKIKSNFTYKFNDFNKLNNNSLTSKMAIKNNNNNNKRLPNTFVPGRNILFYVISAAYAYNKNINNIVSGVCETDYSGYPDCRQNTIRSLEKSVNLGMEKKFKFHTPLMNKNKADIWKMSYDLGGLEYIKLIVKNTHTCYRGNRETLHEWGYGCNNCPACKLRSNGWVNFLRDNKIL